MVAVYFTAPWCQPCKTFKPLAQRVLEEEGVSYSEFDISLMSDSEVRENRIQSVPTVVLYDESGLEHDRIVGAFPEGRFRERVKAYVGQMSAL